jgi:hypothetical protein
MIPYSLEPGLWVMSALLVIIYILSGYLVYDCIKTPRVVTLIMVVPVIVLTIMATLVISIPLITGYTNSENITICKADANNILDTDGRLYGIKNEMVKMEIPYNGTINANVEYGFGNPIIYSVNTPVVCGVHSCGGV